MSLQIIPVFPAETLTNPRNTERATKQSVKIFYDYLAEKNIPDPPDNRSLCQILRTFYLEAKKVDGSPYSKNSLQCLRYGLCRHFRISRQVDIINDADFADANKCYQGICFYLKNQGLDKVDHKPSIPESDLRKLYQSGVFSPNSPRTLQNKVFFEIVIFFCRRSGHNPRDLRSSDFEFCVDKHGRRYVCKTGQQLKDDEHEIQDICRENIMYERGGPLCPVASLEQYIKRLNPANLVLFQRPKKDHFTVADVWYDNSAYGERALSEKMKMLSLEVKLSSPYSNHSIRVTPIATWSKCVFGTRVPKVLGGAMNNRPSKQVALGAEQAAPSKKRKISETRVTTRDVEEPATQETDSAQQSTQEDKTEWMEYKCRSGQVLLVNIAEKPSNKTLCSIGTQTDDTGCINGCTSKYVPLLRNKKIHKALPSRTVVRKSTAHTTNMPNKALEKNDVNVHHLHMVKVFDKAPNNVNVQHLHTVEVLDKAPNDVNVQHLHTLEVLEKLPDDDNDSDMQLAISDTDSQESQSYASDLSAVLRVLDETDSTSKNSKSVDSTSRNADDSRSPSSTLSRDNERNVNRSQVEYKKFQALQLQVKSGRSQALPPAIGNQTRCVSNEKNKLPQFIKTKEYNATKRNANFAASEKSKPFKLSKKRDFSESENATSKTSSTLNQCLAKLSRSLNTATSSDIVNKAGGTQAHQQHSLTADPPSMIVEHGFTKGSTSVYQVEGSNNGGRENSTGTQLGYNHNQSSVVLDRKIVIEKFEDKT